MISVTKANGDVQAFSEVKLRSSIRRAGIPHQLQEEVVSHVKGKLYEGIPTGEIYHHVVEYLDRTDNPYLRSSYSLKQAIMMLGPTGYPFEDFIAVILHAQGYMTEVRQMLRGKCVTHEVDVIAQKDKRSIMVEAKFHNNPGTRSDLHVALYTKARFDDVKEKHGLTDAWIVTNTKATTDAVVYADCMGMKVVSWQHPAGDSLRDIVEKHKLYPVTILSSLTSGDKAKLLANHVTICKDIMSNPLLLSMLDLASQKRQQVLAEISYIINGRSHHESRV